MSDLLPIFKLLYSFLSLCFMCSVELEFLAEPNVESFHDWRKEKGKKGDTRKFG